jgi:regulation of enolase protein 1 (concanavalin A-like superfamily)
MGEAHMRPTSRWKLSLVIAALLPSSGFSQDGPTRTLKGWGQAVDPAKDCKFHLDGDRLMIEVPGTKHDLSAEVGDMKAPRVLREIEGDFIAQVKVSGNVRHGGGRTSDEYLAYHGAGLILWLDERTYVRLERAAIVREEGGPYHYGNFELRKDSQRATTGGNAEIPDQDTYLRLEKRGDRILGATSPDGIHWQYFDPIPVELPRRIKLGFAAINTSTEAFKASFAELEIYKRDAD